MKREYVIPDFLAAVTADALLAGRSVRRPDEPAALGRTRSFVLLRWFKRWFERAAWRRGSAHSPTGAKESP